ncbi:MAG: penicillin acylase family protein, partial [Pseudomonadota bacterium]
SLLEPALPPEFLVIGRTPEPWQPEHSLYVLKLLGVQLVGNLDQEVKRLQLAAQGLSPAEIADILPLHRDDTAPELPDLRALYDLKTPPKQTAALGGLSQDAFRFDRHIGKTASNGWAFAGSRTASGKPLLANDPHLTFEAPSFWYLAHLRWKDQSGETVNIVGASIPTMPLMVVGRSDHVAWGLTTAGGDVQDLFVERVKPDDPTQYQTPDGWAAFETRQEEIKISGAEPFAYQQRLTRHGPLLPRTFRNLDAILPDKYEIALQTGAVSYDDPAFRTLMDVETAKTVQQFGSTARAIVAPMQTILLADTAGSIALYSPARLPKRAPENAMAGRAPVPGWEAIYDWQGFVPSQTMPAIVNPPGGAIGTANSRFVKQNTSPMVTLDWDEPFRQDRVMSSLVGSVQKHTVESVKGGHLDTISPAFMTLRDAVVNGVETNSERQVVINLLRRWDGHMDADSSAPLIMAALFRHAHKAVFEDDLGGVYSASLRKPASSLLRVLTQGGARDWCDNVTTPRTETCGVVLGEALDTALAD